mgnify:CR=1 FL=1
MIAITGATGLIGSHIALALLKEGKTLRLLKRPQSATGALDQLLRFHDVSSGSYTWVDADINDPTSLHVAFDGCERVYHSAAMVSFDPGDTAEVFETNITGTQHVVDQCLVKGIKLTYISSTAAIGDQKIDGVLTEASVWTSDRGRSSYALSKRYAELEVHRGVQEGLDAVIVNPGVVIGPGKWGQSSTTIFLSGKKGMRFYPTGSNGFVDVRDVAEISVALSNGSQALKGQHLLIGENLSFKELFTKIAMEHGSSAPSTKVPASPVRFVASVLAFLEKWRVSPFSVTSENLKSAYRKHVYSNDKIRELGFSFRSIDEAIKYTAEVYRSAH